MQDFRQRVKDLCKEKRMMQKDVSAQLGITEVAFTSLLQRGDPHISTVEKLANIFGISVEEFLQEDSATAECGERLLLQYPCPHCGKEIGIYAREIGE